MTIQTAPERFRLSMRDTLRILWPYVRRNFVEQIQGIWFIVVYLLLFQALVLNLPIVYAAMIATGILVVAVGLMFFMEGLRLGLMPLGETIGGSLPKSSRLPTILLFAFLLGVGATFAEPAIAVLKAAGSGVAAAEAPLLYSLLNEFSGQLVASVGIGVGIAVLLGVLRFFYGWPLKYLAMPSVLVLLVLSFYFYQVPLLNDVLGLAWDCGAVTTGPVTVPLVLALGIGVCRVVASGGGGHSGFGIVTLASLFPILAVLLLALFHYSAGDYVGGPNGKPLPVPPVAAAEVEIAQPVYRERFDSADLARYQASGELPPNTRVRFVGGNPRLDNGSLVIDSPQIVVTRQRPVNTDWLAAESWDGSKELGSQVKSALLDAFRAIVPLCLFLYIVLRLVVKQRLRRDQDVGIGVVFALGGMALFGLGIALGLTPLGGQLGSNIPATFATIVPWGSYSEVGPLFDGLGGKLLAVGFAFFLGYGATLAEPALNALGDTVERITAGAFRKKLLMQSVAAGVGLGIGAGVVKMAFNVPLFAMLLPAYSVVLALTWLSPNAFVNFSWDSAGVTTGPITVPLVLAMGLGIGANVPGVSDGFGILALASVGPIMTVLTVGLVTQGAQRRQRDEALPDTSSGAAVPATAEG
ncbi:MAG: DUF1538 domain-containing protein [Pseudomonadota bacterium]